MLVECRARESRSNSNDFLHALEREKKKERERKREGKGVYGHFLGRFGRGEQGTKILELWMKESMGTFWWLFEELKAGQQRQRERERERTRFSLLISETR